MCTIAQKPASFLRVTYVISVVQSAAGQQLFNLLTFCWSKYLLFLNHDSGRVFFQGDDVCQWKSNLLACRFKRGAGQQISMICRVYRAGGVQKTSCRCRALWEGRWTKSIVAPLAATPRAERRQ